MYQPSFSKLANEADNFWQWLSANMVVSAFAIGALAYPVFYLGFVDTILTIFFINILGILPVCFFSTFGPRFGLRQMVLSRFFFGWYGVKVSESTQHLLMGAILSKNHP